MDPEVLDDEEGRVGVGLLRERPLAAAADRRGRRSRMADPPGAERLPASAPVVAVTRRVAGIAALTAAPACAG